MWHLLIFNLHIKLNWLILILYICFLNVFFIKTNLAYSFSFLLYTKSWIGVTFEPQLHFQWLLHTRDISIEPFLLVCSFIAFILFSLVFLVEFYLFSFMFVPMFVASRRNTVQEFWSLYFFYHTFIVKIFIYLLLWMQALIWRDPFIYPFLIHIFEAGFYL